MVSIDIIFLFLRKSDFKTHCFVFPSQISVRQHPLAAKWTGSGDHFGFMNQPNAGYANFAVLVESLLLIIDVNGGDVDAVRDAMLAKGRSVFADAVGMTIRSKMGLVGGLPEWTSDVADELWEEIEPLLRIARGDWT